MCKIRFLKQITDMMREKIKKGTGSYVINKVLQNLPKHYTKRNIRNKLKSIKVTKYGKNYYSGMNIVKYIIREAKRKTMKKFNFLSRFFMLYLLFLYVGKVIPVVIKILNGQYGVIISKSKWLPEIVFFSYFFHYICKCLRAI